MTGAGFGNALIVVANIYVLFEIWQQETGIVCTVQ